MLASRSYFADVLSNATQLSKVIGTPYDQERTIEILTSLPAAIDPLLSQAELRDTILSSIAGLGNDAGSMRHILSNQSVILADRLLSLGRYDVFASLRPTIHDLNPQVSNVLFDFTGFSTTHSGLIPNQHIDPNQLLDQLHLRDNTTAYAMLLEFSTPVGAKNGFVSPLSNISLHGSSAVAQSFAQFLGGDISSHPEGTALAETRGKQMSGASAFWGLLTARFLGDKSVSLTVEPFSVKAKETTITETKDGTTKVVREVEIVGPKTELKISPANDDDDDDNDEDKTEQTPEQEPTPPPSADEWPASFDGSGPTPCEPQDPNNRQIPPTKVWTTQNMFSDGQLILNRQLAAGTITRQPNAFFEGSSAILDPLSMDNALQGLVNRAIALVELRQARSLSDLNLLLPGVKLPK